MKQNHKSTHSHLQESTLTQIHTNLADAKTLSKDSFSQLEESYICPRDKQTKQWRILHTNIFNNNNNNNNKNK